MLGRVKTSSASRLHARRCVQCGAESQTARGFRSASCPSCGCDFRQRPARSYAEMEGLIESRPALRRSAEELEATVIERWILVIFAGAILIVVAVSLLVRATG